MTSSFEPAAGTAFGLGAGLAMAGLEALAGARGSGLATAGAATAGRAGGFAVKRFLRKPSIRFQQACIKLANRR
jgi:hypothetical protein